MPEPYDALAQPERLAAIAASDLIETGAIPALDRVVRMAARLLDVPVAQLNVVTEDRQIPVSYSGSEAWGRTVTLESSYCQHAVRSGEPLMIPDAREHPLVAESPATAEGGIVAYLSVPILSPRASVPIATLCVVDFRPRAWSDGELAHLADLAAWALSEIELRAGNLRARLRAEAALHESESRLRAIYDGTYEYIGLLAPDGTVLDANRASLEFVGNTRADVVGRPFWETPWFESTPGAPEAVRDAVARASAGEFVRYDALLRRPGREPILFDFSIHPVRDERGEVVFLVPEGRDVTDARGSAVERERLLGALEVERARLSQVFRRAPSFIVAFRGADQVYEFVNEAYYRLIGHREVVGKPLLEAVPEIRDQGFKELLDRVRETGEPWVGRESPVLLQRTPGAPLETRYLDMVFQALTEADGTRSGVVAHGSDVTEQVVARREVDRLLAESERARAEAEAANRGKAEFLATMSHELRTPLNAIGGYVDLLEMEIRGPITAEQRRDLNRIQQSQRHLLGLINEVLNYAKLETGAVHYDLGEVEVAGIVAAAESLVAPQASARGLSLQVCAADPSLAVRADAEKLRQILVNLLGNAVKFTEPGGHVDVSCEGRGDRVEIRVRDTGIGIPADKLGSIFDPFVQVRQDLTRPHEGTGLGLAISRDLARGMGGELSAVSTPGVGSTFVLYLPAAPRGGAPG